MADTIIHYIKVCQTGFMHRYHPQYVTDIIVYSIFCNMIPHVSFVYNVVFILLRKDCCLPSI